MAARFAGSHIQSSPEPVTGPNFRWVVDAPAPERLVVQRWVSSGSGATNPPMRIGSK